MGRQRSSGGKRSTNRVRLPMETTRPLEVVSESRIISKCVKSRTLLVPTYTSEAIMAVKSEVLIIDEVTKEERTIRLEERKTPELVIAFVGPMASGVTTSSQIFIDILDRDYDYKSFTYKISKIIEDSAPFVGEPLPDYILPEERIKKLQDIGNKLREKFGDNYLAKKCIHEIANNRLDHGGYREENGVLIPEVKRFVHIVDSLKHPSELNFLRMVYGDLLTLVGVFAPLEVRRMRLKNKGVAESGLDPIITTDRDEKGNVHGQKVTDTFYNSDLFIRNDKDNDVELRKKITRYLEILFATEIHSPTQDEMAMYTAMSVGSKSACMSRQVGAAIYSESKDLIGIGWNDVPKFGGGLYSPEDKQNDHRCYLWGGKICHNDDRKKKLRQKILLELKTEGVISGTEKDVSKVSAALDRTDIKSLIEYSRSIHAEMEAILSVARSGKHGLIGATIFTSTFPCHNCARHIVAAGIQKVVYIEPYPKSLATDLHNDALSESAKDEGTYVIFQQFDGVAPKNVLRYFKSGVERKTTGQKIQREKRDAKPVFQPPLDSFTIYEQKVVEELHEAESSAKN